MTNEMKIASIYAKFSGDSTPTVEEMYPFLEMAENFGSAAATASIIQNGPLGSILFGDALSYADKVTTVFQGLFGRDPLQAGLDYWVDQLENNSAYVNETSMAEAILRGAEANADQTDWLFVEGYSATLASDLADYTPTTGKEGQDFYLTSGTDRSDRDEDMMGTDDQDTFYADIVQDGGVSNSLSSADHLDGGASKDTLHAELLGEYVGSSSGDNNDTAPHTTNIEVVTVNAIDDDQTTTLDGKEMHGVETIGSLKSDGDLVLENLTTLNDAGTEYRHISDMTITMDHTDNSNTDGDASDLTVYFDEDSFNEETAKEGSTLTINMINTLNLAVNDGSSLIEGFDTLTFTVGTELITVDVSGAELSAVQGLIQDEVNAAGYTDITVTTYQEPAYFGTNIYYEQTATTYAAGDYAGQYTAFLLTNTGTEELVEGGFTFTDGQNDGSIAYSQDDNEAITTTLPLSIDVELEKVGRDGEGGDLIIGGKDSDLDGDTDVDQKDGIEIFNVTVLGNVHKPSNLGTIMSTNNSLKTVTVASEVRTDNSFAALTVRGDSDNGDAPFGGTLDTFDANAFKGDLYIGQEVDAMNIDTFTATGGGNVFLNETISNSVTATVTTGAGVDDININNSGTVSIDTAGAADDIDVSNNGTATIDAGSSNDTVDMAGFGAATIDGAEGNDVIKGFFNTVNVSGGSGNDAIYVQNTGTMAQFQYDTTALVNSVAATADNGLDGIANPVEFFNGVRLQVTIAVDGLAADESVNGFESEIVTIDAATGNLTTEADINNTIVSAINDNPVLSDIAVASIVNGGVQIDYLVDGVQDVAAVEIVFFAATGDTLDAAIAAEWEDTFNDSNEFDPAGENNTVNAEQAAALAAANAIAFVANATAATAATAPMFTVDLDGLSLDTGDALVITLAGVAEVITFTADDVETPESVIADLVANGTTGVGAGLAWTVTDNGNNSITFTGPSADTSAFTTATMSLTNTSTVSTLTYEDIATTVTVGAAAGAPGLTLGTDSTGGNANTVNGNEGDDTIVLSSEGSVAETVVMTAYNQGDDAIVHFTSGEDMLDLSAYLDNMITDSGSPQSAVDMSATIIDNTLNTAFAANSVTVKDFSAIAGLDTAANTVEFSNLTAAEVEAALETATTGYTTVATGNLVENTAKSILIIHNDEQNTAVDTALGVQTDNDGEYSIFEVSYANATDAVAGNANFTVQLIGTVDMGDNVDGPYGLVATDVIA